MSVRVRRRGLSGPQAWFTGRRTPDGGHRLLAAGRLVSSFVLVALVAVLTTLPLITPTAAATPAKTVVSLTFDDGYASVLAAQAELAKRNMNATFFISSGFVGQPDRLTWGEIRELQDAGNEIGGHTTNHLHLDSLDDEEQTRQICDDRTALINEGLRVSNFAYPYGASGTSTGAIVEYCGYNSARGDGGFSIGCKKTCPFAEPMPPEDIYSIRTAAPVGAATSLSMIKEQILDAESRGGGWVPIVFHDVCNGCSDMAISPSVFAELLDWLQQRAANGTEVATIADVVGGDVKPTAAGPDIQSPTDGNLVNPSLELAAIGNAAPTAPDSSLCWVRSGYGTNTATWSKVPGGRSGSWAEQVTVTAFTSGDQKLVTQQDSGSCAPSIAAGHSYELGAWYNSSAPTRIVAYYRTRSGAWLFWAHSQQAEPSNDWRQISWQTPPAPPDATRVSFGLQLAETGTLAVDDFSMSAGTAPAAASASTWQADVSGILLIGLIGMPALGLVVALAIWNKPRHSYDTLTR